MANVQKITPNLWFDGNALEAVTYYASVFPDGTITATTYYPTEGLADFQQALAGKELTVEFSIAGMTFVAINAGPEFKFNESVSFSVSCKDQSEIDYYWDKLSHFPENEQCGWCKDQFGLSWQIVPENIVSLMSPNGSYNPAAFQAMMKMKKLDITQLKNASVNE